MVEFYRISDSFVLGGLFPFYKSLLRLEDLVEQANQNVVESNRDKVVSKDFCFLK